MIKPKMEYDSEFSILYDILLRQDSTNINVTSINNKLDGLKVDNSDVVHALQTLQAILTSVIIEKPVEIIVEKPVEVIKEVIVEKPVEVIKEVIKTVYQCPPPDEYITVEIPNPNDACEPYTTVRFINPEYTAYMKNLKEEQKEKGLTPIHHIKTPQRSTSTTTNTRNVTMQKREALHRTLVKKTMSLKRNGFFS